MSYKLSEAVEYFPDTGIFRWKISPRYGMAAGSLAGSVRSDGYWIIQYRGRKYVAHRLAWLLMTGEWPTGMLDHRNLDKLDNRWENLRSATPTQNNANWKGRSKFSKGVSLHKCGKYQAQLKKNGKNHYLGLFQTSEAAAEAYAIAAKKYFGEFGRAA